MSITGFDHVISDHELKKLLHPAETSRYILALIIAIPATIVIIYLVVLSKGIILVGLLGALLSVWIALQLMKASLMGSSVRVSADNFPGVHEVLVEVKHRLKYEKVVEIYITEGGSFNAFLYKFFRTKFILLNADIVSGLPIQTNRKELMWIVARFIGALKAKHMRLQILAVIVNSVQQLQIFNFLMLPYERATQYSGDQIGLAVCGELKSSIVALGKLMVGKDLGDRVRLKGMLQQARQIHHSLFAILAKLMSTHPHMTDRYLNMLGFARLRYPNEFARYAAQFDDVVLSEIDLMFPRYFRGAQPLPSISAPSTSALGTIALSASMKTIGVLVGVDGPARGKHANIQKSIFKIGSAPENDLIVLNDDYVSSSHAWVCYTEGNFVIVDQNSRNGTWVNNTPVGIEGARLQAGDSILIGHCTFRIQSA